MMALSGELADGAHPYNTIPAHTAEAREILGPGKILCPEVWVLLETDPATARRAAREALSHYLQLENYVNAWRGQGFSARQTLPAAAPTALSTRSSPGATRPRSAPASSKHWDAGADHVCIQPIAAQGSRQIDEASPRTAGAGATILTASGARPTLFAPISGTAAGGAPAREVRTIGHVFAKPPDRSSSRSSRSISRTNPRRPKTTMSGPITCASRTRARRRSSCAAAIGRSPTAAARCRRCAVPGVVGEQPVLGPGESFEYTSGTPLPTPSGHHGRQLRDGNAAAAKTSPSASPPSRSTARISRSGSTERSARAPPASRPTLQTKKRN